MIYVRNNAAKQWLLEELDRRFGQTPTRILDLGCGTAFAWKQFLPAHPQIRVIGVDTDAKAIADGQEMFRGVSNIELRISDAQRPLPEQACDAVVALSAIEHVVDRPAFIKTVWSALRSGGIAYLNYDAGHFRSRDLKERLMVPVSQLLACVGFEGPYMKHVDDVLFRRQLEAQGFVVVALRKHNLFPLKRLMRTATDETIAEWYAFEERLGVRFSPEELDPALWSTTWVIQKP